MRFLLFKGPGSFKKKWKICGNVEDYMAYPLTPPLFFHFTLPLNRSRANRSKWKIAPSLRKSRFAQERWAFDRKSDVPSSAFIRSLSCSSNNINQQQKLICDPPVYTAKNQYRKFETNISRKGIANFHIHVPVSELYIPTIDLPILLQEICGPILGIYELLTDTWMWKLGLKPRNYQKRNT